MHLKIPPLLFTGLVLLLMAVLSKLLPQLSYALPYRAPAAIILAGIGIMIAGSGVVSFRRLQTTVNPTQPGEASTLVMDGIYRFSRNPMYLGFLFILVACGVFLANILVFLIVPPAFVLYMNRYQIGPEEDALTLIFGDEFVSYQAKVRRWL